MIENCAIYVDLDGVLADYEEGIRRLGFVVDPAIKNDLNRSGTGNPLKREMHEAIKGTNFYRNLPIMPQAIRLWRGVKAAKPFILTAAPKFGATEDDYRSNPYCLGAAYHKRVWVEETFLPQAEPYMVKGHGGMLVQREYQRLAISDENFICVTSASKYLCMGRKHSPHQILIDDRLQNCLDWENAGGFAVLYDGDALNALHQIQAHLENI